MGPAEENLPKQGACLVTGLFYTCICVAGGKIVGLIAHISCCVFVSDVWLTVHRNSVWIRKTN